ncbi:MAG: helix-turn-helix transcriptional regulator [Candidatus Pacebacteria bacterium]|nr:helix-turn-helix transcriptional regulator [Candidatus Paceibacterota bacterium]PIR64264.1 MAG: transcriptional regulator [Candidatus Pacebacteria bacterium CG10_big_fil_rev_8_21_14_0_10_40_26]PIZ78688.1 MAG: transcriptional regulator [Candidatus Pacebacteria bacterium CG_4_10_14_0_2_um_filter_40_20]PJA68460.1 MAG: transcriptional regulator [Candidatus Pacebacteria bacterium CG_4_9_14_3_um_filter_40_12]PJC41322.1 MAG: transcriptional regulator [Candidatus Pacebacteria bacterium CG_4_9_14_0_2
MSSSVANCIKNFRQKKKVTQEELADAVGVSRQTIIALEKGNYIPSLLLALSIADYFNESVEKIFHLEKSKRCSYF